MTDFKWTEEKITTLETLWKEGKSANEIATTMNKADPETGLSRNAILGKVYRLGLKKRGSPIPGRRSQITFGSNEKQACGASSKEHHITTRARKKRELKEEAAQTAYGDKIKLKDLEQHHCRWPIGDPKNKDFHFCGAQKKKGKPYCESHTKIAYSGVSCPQKKKKQPSDGA